MAVTGGLHDVALLGRSDFDLLIANVVVELLGLHLVALIAVA